jgi:hypothetical protein
MSLRRQVRPIGLLIPNADLGETVQLLEARRADARQTRGLLLKVRGDTLSAAMRGGRYSQPPRARLHLSGTPRGVELSGVVRESFLDSIWIGLYAGAALFLAAVAVALIATGNVLNPGTFITVTGAAVLGALALVFRRQRRSLFGGEVTTVVEQLRAILPPGTNSL